MTTLRPNPHISVTGWPLVETGPVGRVQSTTFHVRNNSPFPLHFTSSTVRLGGACGEKLHFNPTAFNLSAGHTETIAISTPNGNAGDYLAVVEGTTTGHGVRTGVSIANRIVIGKLHDTAGNCVHAAHIKKFYGGAPVVQPSHFPWTVVGLVAALVVILVLLVVLVRRRHRNA